MRFHSWLHQANPWLSDLITQKLGGTQWLKDLSQLSKLKAYAGDAAFQKDWMETKLKNKVGDFFFSIK